jgi:hypothetical protein
MGVKSLAIGGKKALVTRGGKLVNTGRVVVVVVSPGPVVVLELDDVEPPGVDDELDEPGVLVVVELEEVVGSAVMVNVAVTIVSNSPPPQKLHAQITYWPALTLGALNVT